MNFEIILPVIMALIAAALTIRLAFAWKGEKYLCSNCKYNNDQDCQKAERPRAEVCMAFRTKN